MIFGSVYGSGFGDPRNMVADLVLSQSDRSPGALRYSFTPASGFGDSWFGVYLDAVMVDEVYVAEGESSGLRSIPMRGADQRSFFVLHHGNISNYAMPTVVRSLDYPTAKKVTLMFTWPVEITGAFDVGGEENPDLSAWALTGLIPESMETGEAITRNQLRFDMETDGGTTTLTLKCNGQPVSSGTVSAPGTLTLIPQNNGEVAGTVDVGAAPTDALDSTLHARWPEYMQVLRDDSSPPTTVHDTTYFEGTLESVWTEAKPITPDTYYYRLRPWSDTGDQGTDSDIITIVIPGPPDAPENLAYSSGNDAETILSFTASETDGATYRAYVKQPGDAYMNLVTVAATANAGATTITLPAIVGAPGTARVIVRAVKGGVEERNTEELALEYAAAGDFVPARPPAPSITDYSVGSGLTISIDGSVSTVDAKATPVTLQLFLRDTDGSYDFANPDDTDTLVVGEPTTTLTATVGDTIVATDWKYATLKTATAGGVQSENYAEEVLIYVSDDDAAAPDVSGFISRG